MDCYTLYINTGIILTYIHTVSAYARLRKSRRNVGNGKTVAESDKTKHAGLICENIENPIWKTNNKL